MLERLGCAIPLTGSNLIRRNLEGKSVLDVGCGKGDIAKAARHGKHLFSVGVDLFKPYIVTCKAKKTHDEYILCDIRMLPFRERSFDTLLCLEVLEHLDRSDGLKAITEIEKIAKGHVILSMPVGVYRHSAIDKNPYQEHRSQWSPAEIRRLGYEVHLFGLLGIRSEKRFVSSFPKSLRPLGNLFGDILCLLLEPLIYVFPRIASHMMCIKILKSGTNSTRIFI